MEMEMDPGSTEAKAKRNQIKLFLLLLNCFLLAAGLIGGPILSRMYFLHGGKKLWLSAWTNAAGFPILIIPIAISYWAAKAHRPKPDTRRRNFFISSRWLLGSSTLLGLLVGLDCYLYAYSAAYLPVSVNTLVSSSQLVFTAVFAWLIVKHRFTPYSINAVVLMTLGSAMLGLHMGTDVPRGESIEKYVLGFCITIAAAAVHALFLTLIEYTRAKAGVPITFDVAMQLQFVMSMVATLFCSVPMIFTKDFQTMPKEAAKFDLGVTKYYLIIALASVALQVMIIGIFGVVLSSSSLFGGILTSLLVPVQQVFAVIFLGEGFNAEKGMSLALCLWGFASHLYGGYKASSSSSSSSSSKKDESPPEIKIVQEPA